MVFESILVFLNKLTKLLVLVSNESFVFMTCPKDVGCKLIYSFVTVSIAYNVRVDYYGCMCNKG